jgi:hypothetical protein
MDILKVNPAGIPESLKKSGARWVLWRLENRDGKPTKVPYADILKKARSNDPKTWISYDTAIKSYMGGSFDGIGLFMGGNLGDGFDDLTGLDWDHLKDAGISTDEVIGLGSYAETSPSGTGARCFCLLDKIPGEKKKKNNREIYKSGRFLTVTGHHIEGSPSDIRQADPDGLKAFYSRLCGDMSVSPPQLSTQREEAVPDRSEEEIIRIAGLNKKFRPLWIGQGTGDHSADDLALCNILAWASGKDPVVMDRVFRRSGLYREKWDEKRGTLTYGQITIQKALSDCNDIYKEKSLVKQEKNTGLKGRDDRETATPAIFAHHTEIIYPDEPPEDQMIKAISALESSNNPPYLFVRDGRMVRISWDEQARPYIEQMSDVSLRGQMYAHIDYRNRKTEKRIRPHIDLVRDVIHNRGWVETFPHLTGITETPLMHPDGKIIQEQGYDKVTGLYYSPNGLILPAIPLKPTNEDIESARKTLWEPFEEFSFGGECDRAHVIAHLITTVCRNLINGTVPLLLIDKPVAGTGASLISQVVSIIADGREADIISDIRGEEEWKKSILSLLIQDRRIAIIDNLEGILKSPALAALLTTTQYSDRLLGTNENIRLPHRVVWFANGNNCRLGGDLPRRCYWSRMNMGEIRPWTADKNYKHPDLKAWVKENRGQILSAIFTIVKGWIYAGKPAPSDTVVRMGGFEQWRDVIGGILEYAGIPGFLGNVSEMYDLMDTEIIQWDRFFRVWCDVVGNKSLPVKDLLLSHLHTTHSYEILNEKGEPSGEWETLTLMDVLPDQFLDVTDKRGSFTRMMGNALSKRRDRKYPSGVKLVQDGLYNRAVRWKVIECS